MTEDEAIAALDSGAGSLPLAQFQTASAVVLLAIHERVAEFGRVLDDLAPLVERYTNNPAARFAVTRAGRKDRARA